MVTLLLFLFVCCVIPRNQESIGRVYSTLFCGEGAWWSPQSLLCFGLEGSSSGLVWSPQPNSFTWDSAYTAGRQTPPAKGLKWMGVGWGAADKKVRNQAPVLDGPAAGVNLNSINWAWGKLGCRYVRLPSLQASCRHRNHSRGHLLGFALEARNGRGRAIYSPQLICAGP